MHTDTLIIGAGQAGLALSQRLTEAGHEHLLLERGRVAERWRSERPDSFRLLTPNWMTRLPGYRYEGTDPDGFMGRDEIIGFLADYADSFDAPVHTGITVTSVDSAWDGGWEVTSDHGTYMAREVVVATGHMDRPKLPACARDLPADVLQLHSSQYRNPSQLPDGRVLVVGAGPSGQQVAQELARAGRDVVLAAGRHRALPRRYRGHDVYWWMERLGLLDRTVDTLPDPAAAARTTRSSVLQGGDQDLDLRRLHRQGVAVTGRLLGVDGSRVSLGTSLATDLAEADANADRIRAMVDDHVQRTGLPAPEQPWAPSTVPSWAEHTPTSLDIRHDEVPAVIWATGYGRDWSWIHAPVFDRHGEPEHVRGVTSAPGLSFLGLRWQYRRDSAFIDGVGRDAAHLARHLTEQRVGAPA